MCSRTSKSASELGTSESQPHSSSTHCLLVQQQLAVPCGWATPCVPLHVLLSSGAGSSKEFCLSFLSSIVLCPNFKEPKSSKHTPSSLVSLTPYGDDLSCALYPPLPFITLSKYPPPLFPLCSHDCYTPYPPQANICCTLNILAHPVLFP